MLSDSEILKKRNLGAILRAVNAGYSFKGFSLNRLRNNPTNLKRFGRRWASMASYQTRTVRNSTYWPPTIENLADISEPQVLTNEQQDQYIQFSICLLSFNGRNLFSPIETWINSWKIEFIDLFVHLAEFEVLKYQPSFPYWVAGAVRRRPTFMHIQNL